MWQKKRKSLAGLKKLPCCIVLKIIDLEIQKNRSRQVELVTFIIVSNSNTKMKKQNKQSMICSNNINNYLIFRRGDGDFRHGGYNFRRGGYHQMYSGHNFSLCVL
jgi:hypothetical protein